MTFVVGVNDSTGSNWNTSSGSGNRAITYTPTSSNPQNDVTPLPDSQKLVELGIFLNIGAGRNTTIPIGIYEITGSGTATLLQGFEVPVTDANGTGYQWATLSVDVGASAWAGKRLGVGRTQPRDTGDIGIRYNGSLSNGALYQAAIGFTPDLPAPWPSSAKANSEACYAIFEDASVGAIGNFVSQNSSFSATGEIERKISGNFNSAESLFSGNFERSIVLSGQFSSQNSNFSGAAERSIEAVGVFESQNSELNGNLTRAVQIAGNFQSQDSNFSGLLLNSEDGSALSGNFVSQNSSLNGQLARGVALIANFLSQNSNFSGNLVLQSPNNIPAFPSTWLKMDYQELFDDVAELLYELGDNRLFYKKNESTFNPRTGNVQSPSAINSRVQGQGVMYNFKTEEYDGENVKFGDMMMIFQPYKNSNYAPEIGMFCDTAGATWRLLNFEKIIPANKLIAYIMHLRK